MTRKDKMSVLDDSLEIDTVKLRKAAIYYRAINHQLRQQILAFIHNEGRIQVTLIYVKLRLEQPVCSQHLAILRRSGLVKTEREGKNIFYTINYQRLHQLHQLTEKLLL